MEHEKKNYPVGKRFVITNSVKLKVPSSVTKIEISTFEAVRILRGDGEILREIVRPLQDLPGAGQTPVESTA